MWASTLITVSMITGIRSGLAGVGVFVDWAVAVGRLVGCGVAGLGVQAAIINRTTINPIDWSLTKFCFISLPSFPGRKIGTNEIRYAYKLCIMGNIVLFLDYTILLNNSIK
jgi:hypothetical protein